MCRVGAAVQEGRPTEKREAEAVPAERWCSVDEGGGSGW